MRLTSCLLIVVAAAACSGPPAPLPAAPPPATTRLEYIQRRGTLACGVEPTVPGFAEIDASRRYRGLDVDICRAMSAAIFGDPDKVTFVRALSVADFQRRNEIDVVSRRITWELSRERPFGLLFGPIMFYDGQGFLVERSLGVSRTSDLGDTEICVAGGIPFETQMNRFFGATPTVRKKVLVVDPHDLDAVVRELLAAECRVYTADVSLLGAIRSRMPRPDDFDILSEQISREPLAQIVRDDDPQFFGILRWTVLALIRAEELGVTSANVDQMRRVSDPEVRRLLGVDAGNGKALGLRESWAYDVIKTIGNYGELFEKHVGRDSPIGLRRGLNRLSIDGGLLYAPPIR